MQQSLGISEYSVHSPARRACDCGVAQDEPQAAKPTSANYDAYVNDFPSIDPSTEPGVTAEWSVLLPTYIHDGDLVIPPGNYFAMGDNRTNSMDSRYWGFCSAGEHCGASPLRLLVYRDARIWDR
jgi:signal peptidase I